MYCQVEEAVKNCDLCLRRNKVSNIYPKLRESIFPDHPFHIWSMDTTGKLQLCANGDQYIIIAVENFTKYTVIAPAKDLRSKSVMEFIIKEIISHFGNMDFLLSDNATCFTSKTFNEMAKELGFKIIHSSPRNPQSNGLAENRVKCVKRILTHYHDEIHRGNWSEFLPFIQLALNTSIDASRKYTPFFLLHGFEAKSVFDNIVSNPREGFCSEDEWVSNLVQEVFVSRQICMNELKRARKGQAAQYNKKILEIEIFPNNLVYVIQESSSKNYSYRGPYLVLSELYKNVFLLQELKICKRSLVNIRQLKKINDHERFLAMNPEIAKQRSKVDDNSLDPIPDKIEGEQINKTQIEEAIPHNVWQCNLKGSLLNQINENNLESVNQPYITTSSEGNGSGNAGTDTELRLPEPQLQPMDEITSEEINDNSEGNTSVQTFDNYEQGRFIHERKAKSKPLNYKDPSLKDFLDGKMAKP